MLEIFEGLTYADVIVAVFMFIVIVSLHYIHLEISHGVRVLKLIALQQGVVRELLE